MQEGQSEGGSGQSKTVGRAIGEKRNRSTTTIARKLLRPTDSTEPPNDIKEGNRVSADHHNISHLTPALPQRPDEGLLPARHSSRALYNQTRSSSFLDEKNIIANRGTRKNAGKVKGGQSFIEEKIATANRSKERQRASGHASVRESFMNMKLNMANRRKSNHDSSGPTDYEQQGTTRVSTYPPGDVNTPVCMPIDAINQEEEDHHPTSEEDAKVEEREVDDVPSAMSDMVERTSLQRDHPGAVAVFPFQCLTS